MFRIWQLDITLANDVNESKISWYWPYPRAPHPYPHLNKNEDLYPVTCLTNEQWPRISGNVPQNSSVLHGAFLKKQQQQNKQTNKTKDPPPPEKIK